MSFSAEDDCEDFILDNIVAGLHRQVAEGRRYEDGETMQLGCSLVRFTRSDGDTLELQEPDFRSVPIAFVPTLTWTARWLSRHAMLLESGPERWYQRAQSPLLLHSVILCSRFGETDGGYVLDRVKPVANDSGWFIGCRGDHDHQVEANLTRESIYAALLVERGLADFLILPAGCSILFEPGKTLVIYEEQSSLPFRFMPQAPLRRLYPFVTP